MKVLMEAFVFADNRIMMHLQGLGVVWTLFEKISMISGGTL